MKTDPMTSGSTCPPLVTFHGQSSYLSLSCKGTKEAGHARFLRGLKTCDSSLFLYLTLAQSVSLYLIRSLKRVTTNEGRIVRVQNKYGI